MCKKEALLTLFFIFLITKCNTRSSESEFVKAKVYSSTEKCHYILPKYLIEEIASYKLLVKTLMRIITSTYASGFTELFTHFFDKFGARLSGSESLEHAIDYMLLLTTESGISSVYTQNVHVPHWVRGFETASLLEPREKEISILGLGQSVPTPESGITAQVVVVKSFKELNRLSDDEVEGKIVVFNPTFVGYGETVKYRTHGATKAAAKGAVATLIRSMTPFSLYTLHTGSQKYASNVTKIPTASITVEDANLLERMYHRGEDIVMYMKMSSYLEMAESRNILVDLKGSEKPDEMVLVSGHTDSWDVGEGVLDDGGGMFISWFVPIALKHLGLKPRRTIRAALWTAEEVGLVGSAAYLKSHRHELNKIHFILESDEGTFAPLGLDVGGNMITRCIIAEILKLFTPIDQIRVSKSPGSDMVQFIEEGIPGASLLNQNERYFYYHHTEADTLNVYNMSDVVNCAAFWAAVSYVIADLPVSLPRH